MPKNKPDNMPDSSRMDDIRKLRESMSGVSQEEMEMRESSGRMLSSFHQVSTLFYGLKDGESLVIESSGEVYVGRVKNKKLKERTEYVGRNAGDFDKNGLRDYIRTKWFVGSSGRVFKNAWDLALLKRPKNPSVLSGIFFFETIYGNPDDIVLGEHLVTYYGKFLVVELKKLNWKAYFSQTTGMLRYIVIDGVEYWQ